MATYLGQPASNEKEFIENNPPVTIFYLSDGTKRFSEKTGELDRSDVYDDVAKAYGSKGITSLGEECFQSKYQLKEAVFNYVEEIYGNTFSGCENLSSVSFPRLKSIYGYNHFDSTNIKNFDFPELEYYDDGIRTSNVERFNAPKLTELTSGGAFYGSAVKDIRLDSCLHIGEGLFMGCDRLTSVYLPKVRGIDGQAFANSGITSMVLPDIIDLGGGDYDPDHEGSYTNCFTGSQLKQITVGKNIQRIFNRCFYETPLLSLTINRSDGVVELMNSDAFDDIPTNYKVYVPSGLVDAYKQAQNWSNIQDHIYPIQ